VLISCNFFVCFGILLPNKDMKATIRNTYGISMRYIYNEKHLSTLLDILREDTAPSRSTRNYETPSTRWQVPYSNTRDWSHSPAGSFRSSLSPHYSPLTTHPHVRTQLSHPPYYAKFTLHVPLLSPPPHSPLYRQM